MPERDKNMKFFDRDSSGEVSQPHWKTWLGMVILIFAFFFLLAINPIVIIGAGERGVVFSSISGLRPTVLNEGLNFRTPFIESVRKISVRINKDDVKAEGASKDLQIVTMDVAVNWRIIPEKVNTVYQQVGDEKEVFLRIVTPAVSEVVKASSANKTAEEIITKRPDLKNEIDNRLRERLTAYNIELRDVSLVNVDFSKEFNAAIEAKQVADQQAQQAKFTAIKAEQEAQADINRAKGFAESQKLQQQTLSPEFLQKIAIEKWDGKLPQYTGSTAPLPFLNFGGK